MQQPFKSSNKLEEPQ